jgi:hypothetical protein
MGIKFDTDLLNRTEIHDLLSLSGLNYLLGFQ